MSGPDTTVTTGATTDTTGEATDGTSVGARTGHASEADDACEDVTVTSDEATGGSWAPPSASARRDGATDAGRASDGGGSSFELPFDSWSEAARWWYEPVTRTRTWLSLGYLAVGAVLGPLLFAAMVAVVTMTASLMLVAVGLLLVIPATAAIDAFARLERRRAAWADGTEIPPRELATTTGGWWARTRTRLTDGARWRQVAYLAVLAIAGPILFSIGVAPWGFVVSTVTGPVFGELSLGGVVLAAIVLGAAPRVTTFVAGLATSCAAWFLGPDPTDALEERVVELSTQREQILDAVANERRRIERNLHDGVQQQLVALGIDIGRAHARMDRDPEGAKELLAEAREKVRGSIGELRMIGRGLHPAVLSDRGLDAALSAIVAGAPIPVTVEVSTTQELSTDMAETAYYIVNEAVANVLKHAEARTASVKVHDDPGLLPAVRIVVHDDGRGGADVARSHGSGLAGIAARVHGVDGVIDVSSPTGGPTTLTAVLPIRRAPARSEGALDASTTVDDRGLR